MDIHSGGFLRIMILAGDMVSPPMGGDENLFYLKAGAPPPRPLGYDMLLKHAGYAVRVSPGEWGVETARLLWRIRRSGRPVSKGMLGSGSPRHGTTIANCESPHILL